MNKTSILKGAVFFLFLISFPSLQAQLLWKISGKDLRQNSYLFGTHHLIPVSFLDSVPGLFKAFNECGAVVGEMVLNQMDVSEKIMQRAMLPEGITMDSLLNEQDYALVDSELHAALNFGLKELGLMNPAMIRTMYELELYKKKTGFSDEIQSDSYFQSAGMLKGKKIIGLEDIDKQIDLLIGSKDLKREALLLVETIRGKEAAMEDIIQLNALYRAGKIEELVKMAKKQDSPSALTDEEYAEMVDRRNLDWSAVLPAYMRQNSCFIAVGALHLGGANGLIKQLKKSGFKVTEVKK